MATKAKKIGRPSEYTQQKADAICDLLSQGKSLRSVCAIKGMPDAATVFKWMREHEEFLKQYARAKQESSDAMAEEILDIADDGTNDWMTVKMGKKDVQMPNKEVVNRSRLRVDTRKWLMAKMKPKKYGDKIDLTSDGKVLPTPLLHVLHNNSNTKDTGTPKKN